MYSSLNDVMSMGPKENPSSVINLCIFCYKPVNVSAKEVDTNGVGGGSGQDENSCTTVNRFCKLLERFVGVKNEKTGGGNNNFREFCAGLVSGNNGRLGCCKDCEFVVQEFCEIYHKWRRLELELEWKAKTLVNIMTFANRVPSRWQRLKGVLEDQVGVVVVEDSGKSVKGLLSFRNYLINKCTTRLSKSQPRILVKRITETDENFSGPTHSSSSDEDNSLSPILPGTTVYHLLGTILSFTAVAMLAFTTTDKTKYPSAPRTIDDDEESTGPHPLLSDFEDDCSMENIVEDEAEVPNEEMDVDTTGSPERSHPAHEDDPGHRNVVNTGTMTPHEISSDVRSEPTGTENTEELVSGDEIQAGRSVLQAKVGEVVGQKACIKKLFTCAICSKGFPLKQSLNLHMTKVHSEAVKTQYYCDICNMSFRNEGLLRKHKQMSKSHNIVRKAFLKKQREIKVEIGGDDDVMENENGINTPVSFLEPSHEMEEQASPGHNTDDPNEENTTTSSRDCGESDPEKKKQINSRAAVKRSPKEEMIRCYLPECYGRRRVRKELYEDHKRLHASGQYQCNFCPTIETNVLRLSTHERLKHPNPQPGNSGNHKKMFHCPRCEYETSKEYIYQWHFAKIHIPGFEEITNWLLEECDICHKKIDKRFKEHHFQKCHVTLSNGMYSTAVPRRRFICSICSKSYAYEHALKRHRMLLHSKSTINKRFHCAICNKYYRTMDLLRKHKTLSQDHNARKGIWRMQLEVRREGSASRAIDDKTHLQIPNGYICEAGTSSTRAESENAGDDEIPQRYSLRNKARRSYKMEDEEDQDGNGNSDESEYYSDANSETTSSNDSDDCAVDMKMETERYVKKCVPEASSVTLDVRCPFEECHGRRVMMRKYYEDHLKLHASGQYKCKFCPVIETNILGLSRHEMNNHSTSKQIRDDNEKKILYCPRCEFETKLEFAYERHFAQSHIPGFESSYSKLVQCDICHKKMRERFKENHFKICHGSHGNEPKQARNTSVPTQKESNKKRFPCTHCSKVCASVASLKQHGVRMHPSVFKTRFYCQICNIYLQNGTQFRAHKIRSKLHIERRTALLRKQKERGDGTCLDTYIQTVEMKTEIVGPAAMKTEHGTCQSICMGEEEEDLNCDLVKANVANPGRYSLRNKIKRSYKMNSECNDGNDDSAPGSDFTNSDAAEQSSASSNSAAESGAARKPDVVKGAGMARSNHTPTFFWCSLDGCDGTLKRNMYKHEDHQKLHVPGQYKCKFCPVIESNIIKLSRHERIRHSKVQQSGSRGDVKVFHCPRCSYEVTNEIFFEWHFAKSHIPGFEVSSKPVMLECDICGVEISELKKEIHFANWHDTTGVDPKKIRKCDVEGCSAYFTNKTNQQHLLHKRKVHPSFSIAEIPEVSSDEDEDVEEMVHGKGYQCKLCSKWFKKLASLQNHKRRYHTRDTSRISAPVQTTMNTFICPSLNCTRSFTTLKGLENHQKLHGSFKCQFCDLEKDFAPDLALHETEHSDVAGESTCLEAGPKKRLHCPRCTKTFHVNGTRTFTNHFLQDHLDLSETFSKCPICQAPDLSHAGKWSSADYMRHHFKSQHKTEGVDPSKILRCDLCPAYFLKSGQIINHKINIHFKGKCPVCHKTFTRTQKLQEHLAKIHPEQNALKNLKFICDIRTCTRTFSTQEKLDSHKKECGQDQKTFPCPQCDKQFSGKQNLTSHVNVAHGTETHICSQCGKTFKSKQRLSTHMLYHDGPDSWKFQCVTCSRKFASKDKLELHMRTHTKEKPFICQFCGERYAHRHNWRNHMKAKHKDEYAEEVEDSSATTTVNRNTLSRKGSKKGDYLLAGIGKK